MRACIAYLTQLRHSSYREHDSQIGVLQQSLRLLHEHYNAVYRHDVLLFHTGDFHNEADQRSVLAPIGEAGRTARFLRVPDEHWRLPVDVAPHLALANRSRWYGYPRFSLGYRHMIRWFCIGLFCSIHGGPYAEVVREGGRAQVCGRGAAVEGTACIGCR